MKQDVVIHSKYITYTEQLLALLKRFDTEGKCIYKSRNEIKVFELGNLTLNVKRYKKPIFFNRIVYTFFRSPKAFRAYTYAPELLKRGVETPEPVAYVLNRDGGLLSGSYFISLQSPYSHTMYELGKGTLEEHEPVVRAFARYTARLHQAGVYHKDYSPGNILFEVTDNEAKFSLVDINRMEFCPVSLRKGCANFARLWGSSEMLHLLAKEYASARQADANECTRLIDYYHKRFWQRYTRKHEKPF